MNAAEKLAGAYLRLNGFFLLPHFTFFSGGQHTHVDVLGLRPPRWSEAYNNLVLPVDDRFFDLADEVLDCDSRNHFLACISEVKAGPEVAIPAEDITADASRFIGAQIPILRLAFTRSITDIQAHRDHILIGNTHALKWVGDRIDWMDKNSDGLTKSGSWTWSQSFLADHLYLRNLRADLPDVEGADTVG